MTLNDKQNNTLVSPSIGGGYQTLTTTKSTKGEDIWYKIKLSCSVLIKKISSLLSVDYYKSNSENQFKDIQLQLHATDPDPDPDPDVPDNLRTSVSNPYTFSIQGNKSFRGVCELDVPYDVVAYGREPWYNNRDTWPDASKVSDLTIIDGGVKFNAKNVTDMNQMFYYCNRLTSLDLSNFDTSKVTDMNQMFNQCNRLTSLDLSSFDTSSVTDMLYMFGACNNLTSLDLSSFDTSKVTDMSGMFYYCQTVASLNLSNFYTSKVTNMRHMFNGCYKLASLDLSSFDTSSVTNMMYMFARCNNLASLDLSSFDTSSVTDMYMMFYNCTALQTLEYSLTGFETNGIAPDLSPCTELTTLRLHHATPSYASNFIVQANVPSTCKVTIVS